MANVYLTALHGMPELLMGIDQAMENFKRGRYQAAFEKYCAESLPTLEAVEKGYNNAVDKEQFLINMAEELVHAASEHMDAQKKKSKRDGEMMEYSLRMVVYVFPAMKQFAGASSEPLIEAILKAWKECFPQSNISAATFAEIESGFHKKWCYITTAVCECFGQPDDCYELEVLRDYRDGYLASSPDGEALIQEYYDVAPTIVKRINRLENRQEIYGEIWNQYLSPCIHMIEEEKLEECRETYIRMVRTLQEEYFYTH